MNATTFTLKNKEIVSLYERLFELDGRSAVSAEDGRPRPLRPYQFKGDTRLSVSKNIKALRDTYDELLEQKKKLRVDMLGSADEIPDERKHPNFANLETEWGEIMKSTQDLELYQIKYEDLRAEHNEMPPSVISALLPILKTE